MSWLWWLLLVWVAVSALFGLFGVAAHIQSERNETPEEGR